MENIDQTQKHQTKEITKDDNCETNQTQKNQTKEVAGSDDSGTSDATDDLNDLPKKTKQKRNVQQEKGSAEEEEESYK